MSGQMSDLFIFKDEEFHFAKPNDDDFFNPRKYKMRPVEWSSACTRGFVSTYEVKNKVLFLKDLEICLTKVVYPGQLATKVRPKEINGRLPRDITESGDISFEYIYENLYLKIPFTGGLVIAKDFIGELYVHGGFQPPWKYKTVYELNFRQGNFLEERDLSKKMEEFRYQRHPVPSLRYIF